MRVFTYLVFYVQFYAVSVWKTSHGLLVYQKNIYIYKIFLCRGDEDRKFHFLTCCQDILTDSYLWLRGPALPWRGTGPTRRSTIIRRNHHRGAGMFIRILKRKWDNYNALLFKLGYFNNITIIVYIKRKTILSQMKIVVNIFKCHVYSRTPIL